VKSVSLGRASICRKFCLKIQKIEIKNKYKKNNNLSVTRIQFLQLSVKFTKNRSPAQKNGFHYYILDFYVESDSSLTHTSGEVHYQTIPTSAGSMCGCEGIWGWIIRKGSASTDIQMTCKMRLMTISTPFPPHSKIPKHPSLKSPITPITFINLITCIKPALQSVG